MQDEKPKSEIGYKTDKKGYVDTFLGKLTSRKLLVLGLATVFLSVDKITSNDWTLLALLYIGTQGAIDIIFKKLSR